MLNQKKENRLYNVEDYPKIKDFRMKLRKS